jgi:hypothetical protein
MGLENLSHCVVTLCGKDGLKSPPCPARKLELGKFSMGPRAPKSRNLSTSIQQATKQSPNWTTLMLLTRSLPPQFLLPAWSVRQLAQASQRAPKFFSTCDGHLSKQGRPRRGRYAGSRRVTTIEGTHDSKQMEAEEPDLKPGPRRPGVPDKEYVFHRTFTVDSYSDQNHMESVQQEGHTLEPLSLFDELFPEESQARSKRAKAAEKRLDKLPAFNWNLVPDAIDGELSRAQQQWRKERKEQYTSIPQRADSVQEEIRYSPITLDRKADREEIQDLRNALEREPMAPTLPSLLVMKACSKNLEESDFFRLSSRGEHIEGWASGVIKGTSIWCWQSDLEADT